MRCRECRYLLNVYHCFVAALCVEPFDHYRCAAENESIWVFSFSILPPLGVLSPSATAFDGVRMFGCRWVYAVARCMISRSGSCHNEMYEELCSSEFLLLLFVITLLSRGALDLVRCLCCKWIVHGVRAALDERLHRICTPTAQMSGRHKLL